MATPKNLRIRLEEEEEFFISKSGAALSPTLKKIIDDGGTDDVITLPNIGSRTFPMIISYLETHAAVDLSNEEKWNFDSQFASDKDFGFLKKLMIDAYYLKIEGLKRVLAPKMADKLKILSAKWKCTELRDYLFETPRWKERFVETYVKIDWASEDVRLRRKRLKEVEELEGKAKKMKIK